MSDLIEPSNEDLVHSPDSVRNYVYGLEQRVAVLEQREAVLIWKSSKRPKRGETAIEGEMMVSDEELERYARMGAGKLVDAYRAQQQVLGDKEARLSLLQRENTRLMAGRNNPLKRGKL